MFEGVDTTLNKYQRRKLIRQERKSQVWRNSDNYTNSNDVPYILCRMTKLAAGDTCA